jgi:hypothetical protein
MIMMIPKPGSAIKTVGQEKGRGLQSASTSPAKHAGKRPRLPSAAALKRNEFRAPAHHAICLRDRRIQSHPKPGSLGPCRHAAWAIRLLLLLCGTALGRLSADAQPVFQATDLPHQTGQYQRAYYSTNVDLGLLLDGTNGPLYWNLSQPQQTNETILRTDIIPPDDMGGCGCFTDAAYAERDTEEPDNQIAWRYYSLTNQGRLYYGFYKPTQTNYSLGYPYWASPCAGFDSPTLDVPVSVQMGQTWSRSVAWSNQVCVFYYYLWICYAVSNYFTADAQVDAYGVLALPEIGELPVLRVKEIHDYETFTGSSPLTSSMNLYFYWLNPSLGIVAQAICYGPDILNPQTILSYTNMLLRVFESSQTTNVPPLNPVSDLRIRLQGGQAVLDWNERTNCWLYQIEGMGDLAATNWQRLASPLTNSWSEPLGATQRFYRAFWR